MEPATDTASNASEMSAGSAGSRASPRKSPPPRAHSPQHLMAPRLPPLPPPALGLLGSLQMMHHASPLDLMAAAHHHGPPRSYGSPPPISSSDPSANECKLVDYRGHKVAAFIIQGDTMLCLPQAFELFLKHLVGGLHTVYTKLKRLDIVPLVCNVEQVRILRGLGAIQPGVNRCKLLSCKDFDVLYRDCTTASSRPGRPPKRASVGLSLTPTHMSQNPFKKHRMENGEYSPYENGHLGDMGRMDKSPLLANGYNPPPHMNPMGFMHAQHAALMSPSLAAQMQRHESNMVKGQHQMHSMEALARSGIWENCRAAYEDIVKHLERLRDERSDVERALALDHKIREGSQNGSSPGHSPVLNLSKSGDRASAAERISTGDASHSEAGSGVASPSIHHRTPPPSTRSHRSASSESDAPISELDEPNDKDDPDGELTDDEHDERANSSPTQQTGQIYTPVQQTSSPPLPQQQQQQQQQQVVDGGVNSTETLLRNIQGLLKVAADNARQQERQITYEKAELKMDVIREREVKDNIERQLLDEQKLRVLYQKRYKKERRERQRLQEQLDVELRKHNKLEEALRQSAPTTDLLRILSETESTSSGVVTSGGGVTEEACNSPPVQPASRDQTTTPTTPASGGGDVQTSTPPPTSEKQWHTNYPQPRLDLVSTGAAFWQNYSESLAQELEMERKSRQQAMERDVKSPLSERTPYYKSSVVFSGAT